MAIFGKDKTEKSPVDRKKTDTKTAKISDSKKVSMKEVYGNTKKVSSAKQIETEVKKKELGNAYNILIKPLITEKASNLQHENKYVFEVRESSNKIEITDAIEEVYGIKPLSVNTVRVNGKKVRSGKRVGRRKDWKKAVVTLPAGKTINLYEGV